MKIYEAFGTTLKNFEISASKAAQECGVTRGFMSLFLAGKRSTPVENLDEWLEKLEHQYHGIKQSFYGLLYNSPATNDTSLLVQLVESADDKAIEAVLSAIGRKWKREMQQRQSSKPKEGLSTYHEESVAV